MKTNEYHALCSNEILKIISSLIVEDSNLALLSNNYNSMFEAVNTVNFMWPLISTSLLMSENLYKYDKSYKLISEDTIELIKDKLYMYPIVQSLEETIISPCLLDDKNHITSCFLPYIDNDFGTQEYYYDSRYEKYSFENELKYNMMIDDYNETMEGLRKDSNYGCNDSIIENGFINIKKFIDRTRNSLAHSNYEVIDEEHIRLYHYNKNTKKLDFNIILEPSIIVLIIDELNEIASNKYSYFMPYYYDPSNSVLLEDEITDNSIIEYMLSFEMFDEAVAINILDEIKNKKSFTNALTDEDKVVVINETIYEKIRPAYDVGVILNTYLYCDENGKILADELYNKYGIFDYLNSEYYNTTESNINDNVYVQNKFKFLLLALLNCSLLNGYNINEGKDIETIDFGKMNINEVTFKKFLEKNAHKTNTLIDLMEKEVEKNKKEFNEKTKSIDKKQEILAAHNIDNDYFNVILPAQIDNLKKERTNIIASNVYTTLEIEKAKREGSMYNFDKNISQFIFNHLRNSLAHGYVKFPKIINLSNVSDMVITFEDYNPDNKKELTFCGSMRLGDLLNVITSCKYVNNIMEINNKNSDVELIKKQKNI